MAKATDPAPEGTEQFVVTGAAVLITTGRKNGKPQVARLRKGTIVNAPPNHPSVEKHLAAKTLAKYTPGQPVRPATARTVTRSFGAMDDPVKAPVSDVLPVAPTAGEPATV